MTPDQFRTVTEQKRWRSYAASLLAEIKLTPEAIDHFGTCWTEGGHHMREQIADDRVLVRLLRALLPPCKGGAMELFRGENRGRWEHHTIGLAWTPNAEKARMYGRGLNAVYSGGVLLRARFEPDAIISGPNYHSKYLGEVQFTVDPFKLNACFDIEFYPQFR